jgi:hypothetical protein
MPTSQSFDDHPLTPYTERTGAVRSGRDELQHEVAYWQMKVAGLEFVICDLLVKNEKLRCLVQSSAAAPLIGI